MTINRRDSRLDEKLGQNVKIEFLDMTIAEGILKWNGPFTWNAPILRSNIYYLILKNGCCLTFRKSSVKRIF